ncbi:MAG: DinB family protein [bacterium]
MTFDLEKSIAVLERTPAVLRSLLAGLPPEWTAANEGPDTWSPFDVVGHLIDGEERDWIGRTRIILAQGTNRRFEPFDRFRHLARNEGRKLDDLLDEFARLRAANVATLRGLGLTPAKLALTGEHPKFGRVTLEELLATWTVHDLAHLAQISRVMAKQYGAEVGPWREYLPVLTRQ